MLEKEDFCSSSKTAVGKYDIEKFTGRQNFGMWQCEVRDVLAKENLEEALEERESDMKDDKKWKKLNRDACGSIRLCLGKLIKYPFMKETDANTLWQKLEEKYMTKSIQNKLFLKKKLFRFNMKSGISLSEHIDDVNKLIADIENLDEIISENDKALCLCNSLPEEYDHLVTSLITNKDKLKYEEVSTALLNFEYKKMDVHVHRDGASEAL